MSKYGFKTAAIAAGAMMMAASAHAVVILGDEAASGAPGDTVEFSVSVDTEGEDVAGTQNDITFGEGVAVAARANGRPDCTVNEEINKGGTSFAFQPAGCSGDACTGVRALVLALDNVDPIPDGSTLYTCNVVIAEDATDGEKTMSITNTGASDPAGAALTTSGVDGRVTVGGGGAADANIIIGDASGNAGDTVAVTVTLNTGTDVAGTQNDITFAPPLSVAARANGRPDCTVNETINKGGTSFAFQPAGCSGTECTGVRSLVLALDNVDPIADGSALYTCNVVIAEDAEDGDYELACSNPGASDPNGGALVAECEPGTVTVGGGGDVTPTPTETQVEATSTPTVQDGTPTRTRTPGGGGRSNDDDGCAVVAPADSTSAWLLLLPFAALLWWRRRSH